MIVPADLKELIGQKFELIDLTDEQRSAVTVKARKTYERNSSGRDYETVLKHFTQGYIAEYSAFRHVRLQGWTVLPSPHWIMDFIAQKTPGVGNVYFIDAKGRYEGNSYSMTKDEVKFLKENPGHQEIIYMCINCTSKSHGIIEGYKSHYDTGWRPGSRESKYVMASDVSK